MHNADGACQTFKNVFATVLLLDEIFNSPLLPKILQFLFFCTIVVFAKIHLSDLIWYRKERNSVRPESDKIFNEQLILSTFCIEFWF